jgi:hypothetical protein
VARAGWGSFRGAVAHLALLSLLSGVVVALPPGALAAAPPSIVAEADEVVVDENHLAILKGTYSDPDGDEVTLSASEGDIEKDDLNEIGSWRWTFPALDGPYESVVTLTAEDSSGASSSFSFAFQIRNLPPDAWTRGPLFVPVNSKSPRRFEWTGTDVPSDPLTLTVGCGSGIKRAEGETNQQHVQFLDCTFPTAGTTLVGVQATDDDGASTDGRMETRTTSQVRSVADGRLVIEGPSGNIRAAGEIAVTDLTGDKKADVVFSTLKPDWAPHGDDPGYVQIVLGRGESGTVDLDAPPASGAFRIIGSQSERLGFSLSAAGDVNGDGRQDLLIGAPGASPGGRAAAGSAWVVFGAASTADVDLSELQPSRGFRIDGADAGDGAGYAVAGVGDVNADGYADLAIGAPGSGDSGVAHVILGAATTTSIDLAAVPMGRGFRITGAGMETGAFLAGGDVNRDGRSDTIIAGGFFRSVIAVVYGRTSPTDVDVSSMGSAGFVIGEEDGLELLDLAAGDMDGDGFDDIAFSHMWSGWPPSTWQASVVRGAASNPSIPLLGSASSSRVVRVNAGEDEYITSVAFVDYYRDGRTDLAVGSLAAESNGDFSGSAWLIKGKATLGNVNLSTLNSNWIRVDGDRPSAGVGSGIAGGDVTGDGAPDLVVGGVGGLTVDGDLRARVGMFAGTRIDVAAPTITAPTSRISADKPISAGKVTVRLDWTGSDSGAGVARYEVGQSTNGGAWSTVSTNLLVPRFSKALSTGTDYRFRVRAIDRAGNTSSWANGSTFRLAGYQDSHSAIRYSDSWTKSSSTAYWGGSTRRSSTTSASATFTFTGRSVAWVAPKGPTRGSARIYINGSYVESISLYSATAAPTQVVGVWKWSSVATRSISVRVRGTSGHPRVDVDGFAVIR